VTLARLEAALAVQVARSCELQGPRRPAQVAGFGNRRSPFACDSYSPSSPHCTPMMPRQGPAADTRAKLQQQGGQILAAIEVQPGGKRTLYRTAPVGGGDMGKMRAARQAAMAQTSLVRPMHAATIDTLGPAPESLPMNLRFIRFSC
jgi:hypothetical protein